MIEGEKIGTTKTRKDKRTNGKEGMNGGKGHEEDRNPLPFRLKPPEERERAWQHGKKSKIESSKNAKRQGGGLPSRK